MLALIALILVGVAVIAVAAAVLLRSVQATELRRRGTPNRESVEREVYDNLYGKRSGTVSAPVPAEPPPDAVADSPRTQNPSADPR